MYTVSVQWVPVWTFDVFVQWYLFGLLMYTVSVQWYLFGHLHGSFSDLCDVTSGYMPQGLF